MKKLFINENGQIRNGWWIGIFIGLIILSQPVYKPLKQVIASMGATEAMLELISPLLIVTITWLCMRLRRESLSDVGLKLNFVWLQQGLVGVILGSGLMAILAFFIWSVGGISFEMSTDFSINAFVFGSYLFVIGAFLEELLHRGFIFQRLIDGIGVWPAQLLIAVIFTFGHMGNPGMEGSTQIISILDLFIGSLILGLAYLKTNSLALPIGMHFGWNWFQGSILGFNVSGHEASGVLTPLFNQSPEWLSGGDFGPEASVFSVLLSCVALLAIYYWKGWGAK